MMIYHEVNHSDLIFTHHRWEKCELSFHWHEKIEILQCTKGSFDALINGVHYTVSVGDIVVIGAQVIHRFNIPEDDTEVRLIQFPIDIMLHSGVLPQSIRPIIHTGKIQENAILNSRVSSLFSILECEGNFFLNQKAPFIQCIFSALYFSLMQFFPDDMHDVQNNHDKQAFYNIVEYINNHYTEALTVQRISQELYMDRGKLSAVFLKYAGISVVQYITELRLQKASVLLKSGVGVTSAALECGFQSVRTFNNAYKKYMHEKPSKMKSV